MKHVALECTSLGPFTGSRLHSGNNLASDASGPGSTPCQGFLVDDSLFHPIRVGKLNTRFGGKGGGGFSGMASEKIQAQLMRKQENLILRNININKLQ
jgi:hypothetical protein